VFLVSQLAWVSEWGRVKLPQVGVVGEQLLHCRTHHFRICSDLRHLHKLGVRQLSETGMD
jgi:hypothetical protein